MESLLLGIASFLGGSFLTMVGYVVSDVKERTQIKAKVDTLASDMTDLKETVRSIPGLIHPPPCSFLTDIDKRVVRIEGTVESLSEGKK